MGLDDIIQKLKYDAWPQVLRQIRAFEKLKLADEALVCHDFIKLPPSISNKLLWLSC